MLEFKQSYKKLEEVNQMYENNLKMILIILLSAFTFLIIPYPVIDKQLEPYYNESLATIKEYCPTYKEIKNYKIKFSDNIDPQHGVIGLSTGYYGRYTIQFERHYWKYLDSDDRYSLFIHEASHAMLNVEHIDDPGHYMNPELMHNLTKEVVRQQFIKIIREHCK